MVDSGSSEKPSRRSFFRWFAGASVIAWLSAVFYPIFSYLVPPLVTEPEVASVVAARLSQFPPGSSILFQFGREPGMLIHTRTGEFKAFFATCTHLDCTVQYRDDWNLIWCACHNGRYDLNGRNVSGPPPSPLSALRVEVKEDDIVVHRAEA